MSGAGKIAIAKTARQRKRNSQRAAGGPALEYLERKQQDDALRATL